MKKIVVLALVLLEFTLPLAAQTKTLINLDKKGIALQGYDPVAFFTQGKPVKGLPEFESFYQGAQYLFANKEDKATFDANPAKYEPQFGGFCAYAASENHTAPVKVDAFIIVNGRLLMQYDQGVKKLFARDPEGRLKLADKNWPGIVEREGH